MGVALLLQRSASVLRKYANEDITVGSWILGLAVEYVDERRMCCTKVEDCHAQVCPSRRAQ